MQIPTKLALENAKLWPIDNVSHQRFQNDLHSGLGDLCRIFSDKERPPCLAAVEVNVDLPFARLWQQWFHDFSLDSADHLNVLFSESEGAWPKSFRNCTVHYVVWSAVMVCAAICSYPKPKAFCNELLLRICKHHFNILNYNSIVRYLCSAGLSYGYVWLSAS